MCTGSLPSLKRRSLWCLQNVWFTWVRTPAAVQADIWFGNTNANNSDGRLCEQIAPDVPEELVFTFEVGRANVLLPDGKIRGINIGWLEKGTPLFMHVFAHPTEANRAAAFALRGIEVATGALLPRPAPSPVGSVQGASIPVGELGNVWDKLQAAGGHFDNFAHFESGTLVVDVPANNNWGKTGIMSRERLFKLGNEPVLVTVRLDPARTTGFCVAFAMQPHHDIWCLQNVWFSWSCNAAAAKTDIWFGNTQNQNGRVAELLELNTQREVTFTLEPGRASIRLADGLTRSIAIGWLREGSPIFGHFFAHPAAANLAARLALTGVNVSFGAPEAGSNENIYINVHFPS
jgi:hypothetical protein